MHGILKLRTDGPGRPDDGLARALRARVGTEEIVADVEAVTRRAGTGCLTRPASSCSRRTCATHDGASSTPSTSATRATLEVAPGAIRATLEALRDKGFDVPRLRARRRLLPRGAAPRRALRAARHGARSTASRSSCACRPTTPRVDVGDARLADRRPPGARGLRHVRRGLRRPPGPAPHPHARGLRGPPAAPRLPDRRRAGPLHRSTRPRARTTRWAIDATHATELDELDRDARAERRRLTARARRSIDIASLPSTDHASC